MTPRKCSHGVRAGEICDACVRDQVTRDVGVISIDALRAGARDAAVDLWPGYPVRVDLAGREVQISVGPLPGADRSYALTVDADDVAITLDLSAGPYAVRHDRPHQPPRSCWQVDESQLVEVTRGLLTVGALAGAEAAHRANVDRVSALTTTQTALEDKIDALSKLRALHEQREQWLQNAITCAASISSAAQRLHEMRTGTVKADGLSLGGVIAQLIAALRLLRPSATAADTAADDDEGTHVGPPPAPGGES